MATAGPAGQDGRDRARVRWAHWLGGSGGRQRQSSWLLVEVRAAELRLPILVPFPLGWLAEAVQGASWCIAAYEWARGKPLYVGRWAERWAGGARLSRLASGTARLLWAIRQQGSFTLVSVDSDRTRVHIRIV